MRVIWADRALRNRDRILEIVARESPKAAQKLDQTFARAASGLIIFPLKGRSGRKPRTRELVVHPNYLIIYTQRDDDIVVLTVIHAAQRWP